MKDRLPKVNYKIYPIKGNKYSWKPNERPLYVLQVVKSNMYFGMSRPGLRRTAWPCTRTLAFLVVLGRSWNEHDQNSNLERNDPEQGTTRFQKNGNERNEVVPGTRSFLVVLRVRAQHRNGIFRARTTKIKFGTGTTRNEARHFCLGTERLERGRARNEVVPSRSQGTSTAQERDF